MRQVASDSIHSKKVRLLSGVGNLVALLILVLEKRSKERIKLLVIEN